MNTQFLLRWQVLSSIAIIAFAMGMRTVSSQQPDHVAVPVDTPPSPNAIDYFVRANQIWTPQMNDLADNGRLLTPSQMAVKQPQQLSTEYHSYSLKYLQNVVARNELGIDEVEAGLKFPCDPPYYNSAGAEDLMWTAKVRNDARVLIFAGEAAEAEGDNDLALRLYFNVEKMADSLQHGIHLINYLTGMDVDKAARQSLEVALDHLSSAQAVSAAKEMAAIETSHISPGQEVENIKEGEQQWIVRAAHSPYAHLRFSEIIESNCPPDSLSNTNLMLLNLPAHLESPNTAYRRYSQIVDRIARNTSLPWPEQLKQLKWSNDPLIGTDTTDPYSALYQYYAEEVFDRMLEVQFAIHAYQLDSGRLPTSLQALVPKYLAAVPLDPTNGAQPLNYSVNGNSYTLYSLGLDGLDKREYDTLHALPFMGPQLYPANINQGDEAVGVTPDMPTDMNPWFVNASKSETLYQ
jgi:hypothetical protein